VIDWTTPAFEDFCNWENLIETEDVGLNSFGFIMSPDSKSILRQRAIWSAGYGDRSEWR
jgi:ABC-type polysaccharide transport system permease subunit